MLWVFDQDGVTHDVVVERGPGSSGPTIRLDGKPVEAVRSSDGTVHRFPLGDHRLELRVSGTDHALELDGRTVPAGPRRPDLFPWWTPLLLVACLAARFSPGAFPGPIALTATILCGVVATDGARPVVTRALSCTLITFAAWTVPIALSWMLVEAHRR